MPSARGHPALSGLNFGLKNAGRWWMSVDILGLILQKFLNPANNLDHSLDFPGSPWKVTVERAMESLPMP
jgi:hypothetical protein